MPRPKMKILFPLLVALLLFVLYSFVSIAGGSWFLNPEEHGDYVIARSIFEKGTPFVEQPLNDAFSQPPFVPPGTTYVAGKIVPVHSVFTHYLYAPSFVLGEQGPFFLVSLHGVAVVIAFFYFVKDRWGLAIGAATAMTFALSFPMVYWSNMLFNNIPAFAYFMSGLLLMSRTSHGGASKKNWLLSLALLSVSFLLRYEFIVPAFLVALYFTYRRREERSKVALSVASFAVALSAIAASNTPLYGGPLATGYTVGPWSWTPEAGPVQSLFERTFRHLIEPNGSLILSNVYKHLIRLYFAPLPLILAGIAVSLRGESPDRPSLAIPFLLTTALLGYFVLNAHFHAFDTERFGVSYTRLLLPVYMMLLFFMGSILSHRRLRKTWSLVLVFLVLAGLVSSNLNYLVWGEFGLSDTMEEKRFWKSVDEIVGELPISSVIMGNLVSKGVISRPTLNLDDYRIGNQTKQQFALEITMKLLDDGYRVFLMELPWHETYLDLSTLLPRIGLNLTVVEQVPLRRTLVYIYEVTEPG
ncbi:MAG: hypothetical protein ACE5IJ_03100 [Thermoplasmata archaeon]